MVASVVKSPSMIRVRVAKASAHGAFELQLGHAEGSMCDRSASSAELWLASISCSLARATCVALSVPILKYP